MKYKYVEKCDCCDVKFSEINTPLINIKYIGELAELMTEVLNACEMKGKFFLVGDEEFIVGFKYIYANKKEQKLSEMLCESLHAISCDFYQLQVDAIEICYYELVIAK